MNTYAYRVILIAISLAAIRPVYVYAADRCAPWSGCGAGFNCSGFGSGNAACVPSSENACWTGGRCFGVDDGKSRDWVCGWYEAHGECVADCGCKSDESVNMGVRVLSQFKSWAAKTVEVFFRRIYH